MSDQARALAEATADQLMLGSALAAQRGQVPTWKGLAPGVVAKVLELLADEHVRFTPEALRCMAVEARAVSL
jgi:hypothetical protein